MPRLLLEGKSLTDLLARVREEHGPDVRIVAADRVRSGGIGGFFARESYAVTVDLDDDGGGGGEMPAFEEFFPPAAPAPHSPDPQAPGTLLDLAAAIDAAEAGEAGVVLGTAAMHATTPPRPAPALSTNSVGFTEILARLATLDEPVPAPTPAPAPAAPGALNLDAAGWDRLREVLGDLAPGLDLTTISGALVLVVTPPPAQPEDVADPAPVEVLIPRQGRHRRMVGT